MEKELKKIAIDLGAKIEIDPVKDVQKDVIEKYQNAELFFGTDGTHSVVSKQFFGEENSIKYPFDYVLQIKYEVEGDEKPVKTDALDFLGTMQTYGVGLDEFVGKHKEGKTTITTQLMISKEDFNTLNEHATFKNPIQPFHADDKNVQHIPEHILNIIKGYLGVRIASCTPSGQKIDMSKIKIVVNEAPATRAKEVVKPTKGGNAKVVLLGDAALGLSYFKGVSAAFESLAHFFKELNNDKINEYQEWFDKDFAPRKIAETEHYSKRVVNPGVKFLRFLNKIFPSKFSVDAQEAQRVVDLYVSSQQSEYESWDSAKPYPHRRAGWKPVLTFTPHPFRTLKSIAKHFVDTSKPYKTVRHFLRDLAQPFRAIENIVLGVLKIALALPIFLIAAIKDFITARSAQERKNKLSISALSFVKRIAGGLSNIALGVVLLVTSPLMIIKLLIRAAITKHKGVPFIEENSGVQRLLDQADKAKTAHEKSAIRIDLHRKFNKAVARGQHTEKDIKEINDEYNKHDMTSADSDINNAYFNLLRNNS